VTRGATWSNYGFGYPGTGGAIPALTLDRNPQLGAQVTLSLGNPSGLTTLSLLVLSPEQAALTSPWGGVIATEMEFLVLTAIPAGGADFTGTLPADPAFTGVSEFVQGLVLDGGAHFGVAYSRGLRMTVGE